MDYSNRREEYIKLLMVERLNEHLHEIDILWDGGADEGRIRNYRSPKSKRPNEVVGLMNNMRSSAEEMVLKKDDICVV